METLATVFVIGWGAVVLYLGWMGVLQFRLAQRLQELESLVSSQERTSSWESRAA